MENSGTVHNARVGRSYPVVIKDEASIRIAIDSCNTVSGLCEIWKRQFNGFENVSKLIHCISEAGELHCIVDYLKIVLRLMLDGETALNAVNMVIIKAHKNKQVVESAQPKKPEFDISGAITYSKDLGVLRQVHCHLVGSKQKSIEYEHILWLRLKECEILDTHIECFREYLRLIAMDEHTPGGAINRIVMSYITHKKIAKSGINTPPQKKVERGGFGKSAKSNKVMEPNSNPQKQDNGIAVKELDLIHRYQHFFINFLFSIAIFIVTCLAIKSVSVSNIAVPMPECFIKRGNVTQFYMQSECGRTYLYFVNGKVLTERQFNDCLRESELRWELHKKKYDLINKKHEIR